MGNRCIHRALFIVTGIAGVLSLAGCSLFTSYPESVRAVQGAFDAGQYARAIGDMEKLSPPDRDRNLYDMELGTFRHTSGFFADSNRNFLESVAITRAYDERAAINVRDLASWTAAMAVNDKALPYRGEPFERVLVHTYLALNFLLQNDLENTRVEILQAYATQKQAREEHDKEIARTKEEAQKRQWNSADLQRRVEGAYADQRHLLAQAGNTYQNGFTYYLSSLVYEMTGELSDAYIDAKTVHALNPDFLPTRRDLLRYSKSLGLSDYDRWRAEFGADLPDALPAGKGQVVLLFECGLAPIKEEIKLPLPIPVGNHLSFATIALPKYRDRYNPIRSARLVFGGQTLGVTQPLMDVDATAVRDLWDQAFGIAMRTLIRAGARTAAAEVVRHNSKDDVVGILAWLGILVGSYVIEQADLRSWISLPHDFQALRADVPAGALPMYVELIGFDGASHGRADLGTVSVQAGQILIIDLRSTGVHGTANKVVFTLR